MKNQEHTIAYLEQRRQTPERDHTEAVERRVAALALRIEESMRSQVDAVVKKGTNLEQLAEIEAALQEEILTQIPYTENSSITQEALAHAVRLFIADVQSVIGAEYELKRAYSLGEIGSPNEVGAAIYMQTLGVEPGGTVAAERDGGCLKIVCYDTNDYSALNAAGIGSSTDVSGGRFYAGFPIFDYSLKTIVLDASKFPYTQDLQAAAAHELQHYTTRTLFETTWLQGAQTEFDVVCADIKDEILAYIRQGVNFNASTSFHENALYEHLTHAVDAQKKSEIHILMRAIHQALRRLALIFETQRERAILVYRLIGIPLREMPAAITALGDEYADLLDKKNLLPPAQQSSVLLGLYPNNSDQPELFNYPNQETASAINEFVRNNAAIVHTMQQLKEAALCGNTSVQGPMEMARIAPHGVFAPVGTRIIAPEHVEIKEKAQKAVYDWQKIKLESLLALQTERRSENFIFDESAQKQAEKIIKDDKNLKGMPFTIRHVETVPRPYHPPCLDIIVQMRVATSFISSEDVEMRFRVFASTRFSNVFVVSKKQTGFGKTAKIAA